MQKAAGARSWWAFVPSSALLLLACKGDSYAAERPFLQQSAAEQHAQFTKLEPAKQVRVYLAAEAQEPRGESFCADLPRSAESPLSAVLTALGETKNDGEKQALLRALGCLNDPASGSCDPRLVPIALSAARTILDKAERENAVALAHALQCK
jgi:hypothetical protein